MICPNCGTKNPARSKFCNNCGAALLSDSRQVCPNCQTPNPDDLLYCDTCGTRLADEHLPEEETDETPSTPSASRSEPFSLPSRPPGQTADLEIGEGLPDWLKTGERAGSTEAEESMSSPEEDDQYLPDWARAARERGEGWEDNEAPTLDEVSGDHSPADDLPIWLMDEETPGTIFTSEKSTDELFEGSKDQESDEADDEELPKWLRGLATGTGPLPSRPSAAEELSAIDAEDSGWLSELDNDEDTQADAHPPEEAANSLRGWLADIEAEEPVPEPPTEDTEIPTWLADLEAETAGGSGEIELEAWTEEELGAIEPEEEMPAWLVDVDGGQEEAGEAAESPAQQRAETEMGAVEADEEIPDWLAEMETGAEEDEDLEEKIPGWLADIDTGQEETEEPEPELSESEQPGEEIPDWLAEMEAGAEEAQEPDDEIPTWLAGVEGSPEEAEESELVQREFEQPAEAIPSWLEDVEAQATEPTERSLAEDEDSEVPQWLAGAESETPAEQEISTESQPEGFPQWLPNGEPEEPTPADELAETTGAEEIPEDDSPRLPASTAEIDPDEIPEWLVGTEAAPGRKTKSPEEDTEPLPLAPSQEEDAALEDVDEWLRELGEVDSDETELLPPELPQTELPGWLREIAPADAASPAAGDETTFVPDDFDDFLSDSDDQDELLDWLTGTEAELPLEPESEPGTELADEPAPDEDVVADWSSESHFMEEQIAEPAEAETEEPFPAPWEQETEENISEPYVPADDLPAWLSDVMQDMGEAETFMFEDEEVDTIPQPSTTDAEVEETPSWPRSPMDMEGEAEPTPIEELPEWLRPPTGLESVSRAEGEQLGELLDELPPRDEPAEALTEAEIPEWLQALKPRELFEGTEGAAEGEDETRAVTAGPLAGLHGVIDIEPVVARPRTAERGSGYTISKEQQQQATLLRQLVHTVPQETAVEGARPEPDRSPSLRILLALLLFAALLAGYFFPDLLDLPAPHVDTEGARALVAQTAPRPVLVAFDYTPAMAGALDAHASLLLQEIAAGGSPVLFASQSAAGLALAEQKVASIGDLQSIRLGYIPGNAVGLRRLAPCLHSEATCQTLYGERLSEEASSALAQTGLVIVLAGDRESAINWIEQVASTTGKPMLAAVPQAVAPVLAPYNSSGQLTELLSASAPALTAEESTSATPEAGNQATAVTLAQWLVIGLLLVGNLIYLVRGSLRARLRRSHPRKTA